MHFILEKLLAPAIGASAAFFLAYIAYRRSIRPVLVFTRRKTGRWQLENIGNGPANQIVIGYGTKTNNWECPTLYYPLSAKATVDLKYIPNEAWGLAVKYTDIHGNWYATSCKNNINEPAQQWIRKQQYVDWLILRTEGELEMVDDKRLTLDALNERMTIRKAKGFFEGAI